MIVANDATVKGGTYYPLTVKKHLRAQEIAQDNELPCIYLVDSGGAFLPLQAEVFPDRDHFGRIFYNQAHMSEAGIPQLSAVMGSCTAGGAYVPAMSRRDRDRARHRHDLPRRPAAREGGDGRGGHRRGARRRGRARAHLGRGGRLAVSDEHALALLRESVATLERARYLPWEPAEPEEPAYDPEELYGIVSADSRHPYDVREVIARLVDGSRFTEFKPLYGDTLVCGFAHIWGFPVAIVANNGILFSASALKGAHFVQLACQRRVPLLFLQNITGFMVGREYEHGGIAKDGAKLVTAVACAQVPPLHGHRRRLVRRGQLRHVRTGVLSAPAVHVAERADLGDGRAPGGRDAADGASRAGRRARRGRAGGVPGAHPRASTSRRGTRYYATARLWDDGVLDPLDTRRALALGLAASTRAPVDEPRFGVFRM